MRRALLLKRLHLLIALLLRLRHALKLLALGGRRDRAGRYEFGEAGEGFQNRLAGVGIGAELRKDFLKLLNDKPQPLQPGRLVPAIRRRLRGSRLPERRLLRLGWISGRGGWGHLLALVFPTTVVRDH